MSEVVYINGKFVPREEALLPVEDRGNVFADGVYEVVRFYGGYPLALDEHMERLVRSARAIRLPELNVADLAQQGLALVARNEVRDGTLYIQVTRGVAPRNHAFPPAGTEPTCFMIAREVSRPDESLLRQGASCISLPDTRWARCDIKSIGLLPNVLAKQEARERGAYEALFVRDGVITEGSSSNVFAVRDGALITHPEGPQILPGITRRLIVGLAGEEGIPVDEGDVHRETVSNIDELFISSTTTELMPVVRVDDEPVGGGRVGPITRRLQAAYERLIERVRAGNE